MTENALSKTAALRIAQDACGSIIRRSGTDYVCYVPYYDDKCDGPSTELQADSYTKIVQRRATKVATIALNLMGVEEAAFKADYTVYNGWGSMSAKSIVEAVIKNA